MILGGGVELGGALGDFEWLCVALHGIGRRVSLCASLSGAFGLRSYLDGA